ncbi:MAG: glycosyltransferase family 4 protein [Polyangiales bacterium]
MDQPNLNTAVLVNAASCFVLKKSSAFSSDPRSEKIAIDIALALQLRNLQRAIRFDHVVAHHIEAAAACAMAKIPFVYVAHTSLHEELPGYLPKRLATVSRQLARPLEQQLIRRSKRVAAVGPSLADHLASNFGRQIDVWNIPWPVQTVASSENRSRSRKLLGFHANEIVYLYAGNLDHYQGWEDVVYAHSQARSKDRLRGVFVTGSDPSPLTELSTRIGTVENIQVLSMNDANRELASSAADLAVIPRRVIGGVPIKLLDAMSRGIPTIATRRATAGLPLEESALLVRDDQPFAMAQAIDRFATEPSLRHALGSNAYRYIAENHAHLDCARKLAIFLD